MASAAPLLARLGWRYHQTHPITGDASTRRYTRLARDDGTCAVLVHTSPPTGDYALATHRGDDGVMFKAVSDWLIRAGLSAPRVLAHRAPWMLVEDLGEQSFTALLHRGDEDEISPWYETATRALMHLPMPPAALPVPGENRTCPVPLFNEEVWQREAALFPHYAMPDFYHRPVDEEAGLAWRNAWQEVRDALDEKELANALVLRDVHAPNLMCLPQRSGLAQVGFLDFQDAVCGPRAYDLVSLLEDARQPVPEKVRARCYALYREEMGESDALFAVMKAHKAVRVLGTFARLGRAGKEGYRRYVPISQAHLRAAVMQEALAPVARWLEQHT